MMNLYYMFKRSGKKWKSLKEMGSILEEHVLKPTRSQGTRWIGHRKMALDCLIRNYSSLVRMFEEFASGIRKDITPADVEKIKGRHGRGGYLGLLRSAKFLMYLHLYRDLIDDLGDMSLTFQRDDLPISEVQETVDLAEASLRRKVTAPGAGDRTKSVVQLIEQSIADDKPTFSFHDIEINLTPYENGLGAFGRQSVAIVESIINCIGQRFASFSSNTVVSAADIINPANYPNDRDALLNYGNDHIETLVAQFRPLLLKNDVDIDSIPKEWIRVKLDISRHHRDIKEFQAVWQMFLLDGVKKNKYCNFLHLVRIILVLPVSTAQVERQFSTIKRMLGDWRLKLHSETLDYLLRISTEGPSIEAFDPSRAVQRWWSKCPRRPGTKPYGKRSHKAKPIPSVTVLPGTVSDSESDIYSGNSSEDDPDSDVESESAPDPSANPVINVSLSSDDSELE